MSSNDIRVLLCDDSAIVRRIVRTVVDQQIGMSVVGEAPNGQEGVRLASELRPDVIVMDVEMPICDGIEAVEAMRRSGSDTPVIMFSSLTDRGAEATIDALTAGACDFACKPAMVGSPAKATEHVLVTLVPKIKLWGRKAQSTLVAAASTNVAAPPVNGERPNVAGRFEFVSVGVSTGGPEALKRFVGSLPSSLSVPIIVVQHMPANFTTRLADQLDRVGPIRVVEGADGMPLESSTVYIAPGGLHTEVVGPCTSRQLQVKDGPLVQSCKPSVDVLFSSAARAFGPRNLSIVLTGMGQDGLEGAKAVRDAGGHVIVQDERSSVVWGMPGVVWKAGLATEQLPPNEIAQWIGRHSGAGTGDRAATASVT